MLTELIIRKDKKNDWFRVFLPGGEEITHLMEVKMVRDKFENDNGQRIIATFEAVVKIGEDI